MACPYLIMVIEALWLCCVQIQGKDRALVAEAGLKLDLEGTYIARSYIEQVCMRMNSLHSIAASLMLSYSIDYEGLAYRSRNRQICRRS